MKVQIITVGDEILIGQIVDTNSAWMAAQLNLMGIEVVRKTSVGDEAADIAGELRQALNRADVVLITGGLGPTKDDITKKTLADFFGVQLEFSSDTYERIVRIFERLGRSATESHRQQAFMPSNAVLLPNKMGTAPGMWFDYEGKVVISLPGVPFEMKYLMENEVLPRLQTRLPGRIIAHRTILTAGAGESTIAERLTGFEESLPPSLKLAYLPNLGKVRLRLTARGADEQALQRLLDEKTRELSGQLPDLVFGYENDTLEEAVGRLLRQRGQTLGAAESCTGGFLSHCITAVPGSSDYFRGAVVAYSNDVKRALLGVAEETLRRHGAVSGPVVEEMVRGAVRALDVDVAVAVSGIAGPGGGTPEKPVGTIWMAVGDRQAARSLRIQAGKDRLKNIEYASVLALNLVRQFLLDR